VMRNFRTGDSPSKVERWPFCGVVGRTVKHGAEVTSYYLSTANDASQRKTVA
jgi:hypothetical protein